VQEASSFFLMEYYQQALSMVFSTNLLIEICQSMVFLVLKRDNFNRYRRSLLEQQFKNPKLLSEFGILLSSSFIFL